MVNDKEMFKIRRYRRKLIRFSNKVAALGRKAPNDQLGNRMREVLGFTYKQIDALSGNCPLEEQIEK